MFELDPNLFPKPPKPSLFPELEAKKARVKPGEYEVVDGNDKALLFINRNMEEGLFDTVDTFPFTGVYWRGIYSPDGLEETGRIYRVVSFLYHKLDQTGKLEIAERAIVLTGIGYGEHRGHTGQPPSWYLVGPQVGSIDPLTGQLTVLPEIDESVVATKHFSVSCITGGPLGQPILANPS